MVPKMKLNVIAASMGLIFAAAIASAQAQRAQPPVIATIVNAGSSQAVGFLGGTTNWSGTIVSIYGSGLSQQGECKATTIPYPLTLCGVTIGTMPGTFLPVYWSLLFVSPNQINALITTPLPFVVIETLSTTVNGVWSAGAASFTLPDASNSLSGVCCFLPGLFTVPASECPIAGPCTDSTRLSIRGAVTDTAGDLINSANPVHLNQALSAWSTGSLATLSLFQGPSVKQDLMVKTLYEGPSQFPGLNQTNFLIAPSKTALPCGVDLSFEADFSFFLYGGARTNHVFLPVSLKATDNPCS
jgi:uncharacterized protein (TIGR03437 family)